MYMTFVIKNSSDERCQSWKGYDANESGLKKKESSNETMS